MVDFHVFGAPRFSVQRTCFKGFGGLWTENRGAPKSGTKKEPKPKLLSPDIFWWGGGLPREGVGGQKVRYVPRNPGNQTFLAGYPGILPGYPGSARKV